MYFPEKPEILKGRGGSRLWNSEGMGGVLHFGISEGKGGLKYGGRPLLGMDIFWNCPIPLNIMTNLLTNILPTTPFDVNIF